MSGFFAALQEQRWDDHRFYHHSRINQTLHLISACSFVVTYVLLFTQPVVGVLLGWIFSMCSRQIGHFFFEPKGFDEVNQASHEYKERVKVGYNLKRKIVLLSIWAATPLLLRWDPTFFGVFAPHADLYGFVDHLSKLWLCLAGAALLFRTIQLFFVRDVQTGIVWFVKILTDPFHDIKQYYKAPFYLLKGEMLDPMFVAQQQRG